MVSAEMIPIGVTSLSFWQKFYELQYKMFFNHQENVQNHMYSSEPLEWPLTGRGIAYWVSSQHNVSGETCRVQIIILRKSLFILLVLIWQRLEYLVKQISVLYEL